MVGFQLRNRQGTRLEVKALLPFREVSGCVPVKAVIANLWENLQNFREWKTR